MSDKKKKILQMLVESLQAFRPELTDIFVCPVCLREVPLSHKSKISEAHILPKAAKGVIKTFLCVTCNSTFGAKQDKWFGEFLNIQKSGSIFAHSSRDVKNFSINGLKINGTYRQEDDGGLGFYIHTDRNPPDILQRLQSVRHLTPGEMTLNISFPILKNQQMVNVGFLTAGYLMWGMGTGLDNLIVATRGSMHLSGQAVIRRCKEVTTSSYQGLSPLPL